jgi:tRNA dimethylallyltransferase
MQNFLIVVLGPTGVGKTDIAIDIAVRYRSEIISCDSRQFYKELEIGTAVPSKVQLEKVPHHFIKFIGSDTYYSSNKFASDVLKLLPTLFAKNRLAVMAGGSGLYIDEVCRGSDNIPDTDPHVRLKYLDIYEKEGIEALRLALKLLDPDHYKNIDLKNPKRLLRALEVCESSGLPYSSFLNRKKEERDFNVLKIGLRLERDELYSRINKRVDTMIDNGLEEEARKLYHMRHCNSLNTVGYKELFGWFEGKYDREEAIRLIKRNTRRYAKRQITWWARDTSINWFHPSNLQGIFSHIEKETGIL